MVIRRNFDIGKVTYWIEWKFDAKSVAGDCDFVRALTNHRNPDLIDESQGGEDIVDGPVLQDHATS